MPNSPNPRIQPAPIGNSRSDHKDRSHPAVAVPPPHNGQDGGNHTALAEQEQDAEQPKHKSAALMHTLAQLERLTHDIKSPLSSAFCYTQIMLNNAQKEPDLVFKVSAVECLPFMQVALEQIYTLIEEMLTINRDASL